MAGCIELHSDHVSFLKYGLFLNLLVTCELLKKNSSSWSVYLELCETLIDKNLGRLCTDQVTISRYITMMKIEIYFMDILDVSMQN